MTGTLFGEPDAAPGKTPTPRGPSGLVVNNIGEWRARDILRLPVRGDWRNELDALTARYGLWRHWHQPDSPARPGYYLYDWEQVNELARLWDARDRRAAEATP